MRKVFPVNKRSEETDDISLFVSNGNPLQFTCFGFCAMERDDTGVVYFLFTHLLGRSCYVEVMCIYICVLKASGVRVSVRVIVLFVV